MKQYAVTIPNNKSSLFLKIMKSLTFIKEVRVISDSGIPEFHKDIIDERLKYADKNQDAFEDWDKVYAELEKHL